MYDHFQPIGVGGGQAQAAGFICLIQNNWGTLPGYGRSSKVQNAECLASMRIYPHDNVLDFDGFLDQEFCFVFFPSKMRIMLGCCFFFSTSAQQTRGSQKAV